MKYLKNCFTEFYLSYLFQSSKVATNKFKLFKFILNSRPGSVIPIVSFEIASENEEPVEINSVDIETNLKENSNQYVIEKITVTSNTTNSSTQGSTTTKTSEIDTATITTSGLITTTPLILVTAAPKKLEGYEIALIVIGAIFGICFIAFIAFLVVRFYSRNNYESNSARSNNLRLFRF